MHNLKKKSLLAKAEVKTFADFALMLEYTKGLNKTDAMEEALKSLDNPLFDELLKRNIKLFKHGIIVSS